MDLAIGKLAPDIARELVAPHMVRFPLRAAFFFHGLAPKHVLVDGMRWGAVPFAACEPPCIQQKVAALRGEREERAA